MEIRIIQIEDLIKDLPEDEILKLSDIDGVIMSEMLLAVSVALCPETKNFASQVFQTEDGRFLTVTAQYTDGVTLTAKYAELEAELDKAQTLLAEAELLLLKHVDGEEE